MTKLVFKPCSYRNCTCRSRHFAIVSRNRLYPVSDECRLTQAWRNGPSGRQRLDRSVWSCPQATVVTHVPAGVKKIPTSLKAGPFLISFTRIWRTSIASHLLCRFACRLDLTIVVINVRLLFFYKNAFFNVFFNFSNVFYFKKNVELSVWK